MKYIFPIISFAFFPFVTFGQSVTIEPAITGTSGSNMEIIGVNGSATPLKLFSNNYYNYLRFYTIGGQEQGSVVAESGIIGLNGLGKTTLNVNNSPRLTINANGNVGIGNSYDGDTYKFSVKSNSSSIASFFNEDPDGIVNVNYNDKHFLQVSPTLTIYYGDTDFRFESFANKTFEFVANGTSRLFISNNFGNVGVGTKIPTAKLEVNGYTKLGTDAPAIKLLKINSTTASTQGGSKNEPLPCSTSQVISVEVLVEYAPNNFIHSQYTRSNGGEFDWSLGSVSTLDFIQIVNSLTNSSLILSKPMKILITYEE